MSAHSKEHGMPDTAPTKLNYAIVMNPNLGQVLQMTRRQFFGRTARGIGGLALASLRIPGLPRGAKGGSAGPSPTAPRVRGVIYLTRAGGPSHRETFDYKPTLAKARR